MAKRDRTYTLTGLLIALAIHLFLLVLFLSFKLGEAKLKNTELVTIEFVPEEIKELAKIPDYGKQPINSNFQLLSQEAMSNIASNTAEKLNENISTDKYINEVMNELGIKDLNPNNSPAQPDDESISEEDKRNMPSEKQKDKENSYNFGNSRVEYNIGDGRKARYVDRPNYRCQGGGNVVVRVVIGQSGEIIESKIESSTTSEECIIEAALASANRWLFKSDYNAPKRVDGQISFIFVPQ
jgi:hypothetical protein